jgi:TniQ protein
MNLKLSLTLEVGEHETPPDFASRLATRVFRNDLREFCRDFSIDPQGVIDGSAEAVGALSKLAGVSSRPLLREAFTCADDKRRFRHKGQDLRRESLTRNRIRMCPACMVDDIDRLDCRVHARPHRRSMWLIRGVRTCERHGMALSQIGKLDGPTTLHDTSRVIANAIPHLESLQDEAALRSPSKFEKYIAARLAGRDTASWLDTFPLYAALHLTFVTGAVAVHGPRVFLENLTDEEAWECEAEGFEIVRKGDEGIRALLDELQANLKDKRSTYGLRTMYGRLYEWLAHWSDDKVLDPVREIITQHAMDTLPIGPGKILFGKEIQERRTHSVYSASTEFGLHPKRLRRMLKQAEITETGAENPTDDKVTFDSAEANAFLSDLSQSMSLVRAREYLNVPRPHDRGLLERGFIKPMMSGGTRNGAHAFLKSDLDELLARLMRDADPGLHDKPNMVPFTKAAKRSCCAVMDIVELVLDGKLARVGRDPKKEGFVSILVDAEEVRALVTGPDQDGHSLKDLERLLPASTKAVKALVEHGFLKAETIRNPVTKWMQPIVRDDELIRFKNEYVSLFGLAREKKEHHRKVKRALIEAGVQPVADPDLIFHSLYRRADLP